MKKAMGILLAMVMCICSTVPAFAAESVVPVNYESADTFSEEPIPEGAEIIEESVEYLPGDAAIYTTVYIERPSISTFSNIGTATMTTTRRLHAQSYTRANVKLVTKYWYNSDSNSTGYDSCEESCTVTSYGESAWVDSPVETTGNDWLTNNHWTRMTAVGHATYMDRGVLTTIDLPVYNEIQSDGKTKHSTTGS